MIKYVTVNEALEIYNFDGEPNDYFVIENVMYVLTDGVESPE